MLLSYVGIIAVVAYAATSGAINASGDRERQRQNESAQQAEQKRADAAIVATGQASIRSGCLFDNQRARELKGILKRSLKNQKALAREGALPPAIARRNISITRDSIKSISLRDCDKAAETLTAKPDRSR